MAVLAVLAPSLAAAAPVLNAPGDVSAITALEMRNAAQLDGHLLAETYAPHAVVLDYMAGALYKGRAEIEKSFTAELAPAKSIVPNMQEASILTDGKFACDAMTTSFQFILKNGKTGSMSLRQLDALEKIDGKWQIVQEEISAPMDPKTGMAVMSGLPVRGAMAWPADILAGPATTSTQADTEITAWFNKNARGIGIEAAMAPYGPGESEALLYGEMAPGNLRGKTEIRAYYLPVMGSYNALDLASPLLRVNSDGLLGAQIDTQDITLHLVDGKTRRIGLHQMDCLHRVGDQWYTVEEMVAFPVDLATGKSVTDPAKQ
jgi:ketosteroid isomerase-like protein